MESELSCEEILEGHPYRRSRKRQMTGRSRERKQAIDNIQEKNREC